MSDTEVSYSLIDKAMSDSNVSSEKLAQVIGFYRVEKASEEEHLYLAAMSELQGDLPSIRKSSTTNMGAYANFDTTMDVLRPFFKQHSFSFSTKPRARDDGLLDIISTLSHAGGHRETIEVTVPLDDSGKKSKIQQFGSSLKYFMRYNLVALLSISTHEGDDDDGMMITACEPSEASSMEEFCKANDLDAARYFKYYAKVYKQPIA